MQMVLTRWTKICNMFFYLYFRPTLGPNAANIHIIADLYAEVLGVLAHSRWFHEFFSSNFHRNILISQVFYFLNFQISFNKKEIFCRTQRIKKSRNDPTYDPVYYFIAYGNEIFSCQNGTFRRFWTFVSVYARMCPIFSRGQR